MRFLLLVGLLGCSSKSATERAEAELRREWPSDGIPIACRDLGRGEVECIVGRLGRTEYRCIVGGKTICTRR